jgi:co-chaperonin GroES (HSP10)
MVIGIPRFGLSMSAVIGPGKQQKNADLQSSIIFCCFMERASTSEVMAVGKGITKANNGKELGAINVVTGNRISRDASSGRFFVEKESSLGGSSAKKIVNKKAKKTATSSNKNAGGFTINKKKAEMAEKAVLSYINSTDN